MVRSAMVEVLLVAEELVGAEERFRQGGVGIGELGQDPLPAGPRVLVVAVHEVVGQGSGELLCPEHVAALERAHQYSPVMQ